MTHSGTQIQRHGGAQFSIPAILAIICAIVSFFVSSGWALLLAIAAVIFGLIGAVLALSPRVRGGMISIFSIAVGLLAALISIIRLIFTILT